MAGSQARKGERAAVTAAAKALAAREKAVGQVAPSIRASMPAPTADRSATTRMTATVRRAIATVTADSLDTVGCWQG